MADMVKRFNTPDCESGMHEFEPRYPPQLIKIGLIPKISVLFLLFQVFLLDLSIFCSISEEIATFYLSF